MSPIPDLAAIALLAAYLAIQLIGIDVAPIVHQDEPWQASVAWSIVEHGRLGSEAFTGLHGTDQHLYAFPPLHPLLQAPFQLFAGPSLLGARTETVFLGAVVLLLTFRLGRRVAGPWVGLGAMAILLLTRTAAATTHHLTGIPLIDVARIARYDIAVPVFGLAALLVALPRAGGAGGFAGPGTRRLVLAGAFGGLATLAHLYGAFWLAVVAIVAALQPGSGTARLRRAGLVVGGAGLVALPYVVFVASGFDDFRAQVAGYAPRFQLLDAGWYLDNILDELSRYSPGGDGPFRPGVIAAALAVPASVARLLARARRGEPQAAALAVASILIPAALALLVSTKTPAYLVAVLPVWAIAVAWAAAEFVRARRRAASVLLTALAVLVAVEGVGRLGALGSAVATTTPYERFATVLRGDIRPGARVLSLHDDWFAFVDADFRSWLVPIVLADPATGNEAASIERSLDTFDPDVVIVGPGMRTYLDGASGRSDPRPAAILAWLVARAYVLERTEIDASYGRYDVYVRDVSSAAR